MPLQKPYFNLHQIITGQYTPGNEFVMEDGSDYIGQYHILPTNQYFTHPRPESSSMELFVKRFNVSEDSRKYTNIRRTTLPLHDVPVPVDVQPTTDDYNRGEMERYFVQKRNSPMNTIMEIDAIQFNRVKTSDTGINAVVWNKIKLRWKISKLPAESISMQNQQAIIEGERKFPGLKNHLKNLLEFYQ